MELKDLTMLALLALVLSGTLHATESQSTFTPFNGFGGLSEGDGTLKLFFGKHRIFHVDSHGHKLTDGAFRIDQTITFLGKPPQKRHWIIKTTGSNKYTGTLSDASGSVTGRTEGSHLFLKYRIKGPLVMHQTLELLPDGKTIDNVGKITLFGIPIGFLRETILRKE